MKKIFKTIDIQAQSWFDKVNGNSYFDCTVTVDYQLPTQRTFKIPFQYGYGSHYETKAMEVIKNEFPAMPATFWELRDKGVIVRSNKREDCLKRELLNPTQKMMDKARKDGWSYYPYFEPAKTNQK